MEQNKFIHQAPAMAPFNTRTHDVNPGYHVPVTSPYHAGMDFMHGPRMPTNKMMPSPSSYSQPPHSSNNYNRSLAPPAPYPNYKPHMEQYPPVCHPYSIPNQMPRTNGSVGHGPPPPCQPPGQPPGSDGVHSHSAPPPAVSQENNGTTYFQNSMHLQNGIHQHHPPFDLARSHMNHLRPVYTKPDNDDKKANVSLFMDEALRRRLLNDQMVSQMTLVGDDQTRLPAEIDTYHQLFPLENCDQKSATFNPIITSTFRVNHRDGLQYCMKRIHACRNVSKSGLQTLEKWKSLRHSNIVSLHEVFTTKAFHDQSLVFIYNFHPSSDTFMDILFRSPNWTSKGELLNVRLEVTSNEQTIWSFIVQLTSAIRQIHSAGLAYRSLDLTKILLNGKNRLRLGAVGIKDLLSGSPNDINRFQQQDMIDLGHVILSIASNSVVTCQTDNIGKALEIVQKKFSKDLHGIITYLIFGPNQVHRNRNINDLMPLIGARFYTMVDDSLLRGDEIEKELSTGLENGRLFRLMCKLGAVDRNDFSNEYETGDRYLLKLFRNHLFHQMNENGSPWLDMSHIVQNLNKLDIGSSERFLLTSNDNENVLVVSYNDIQHAVSKCFQELLDNR